MPDDQPLVVVPYCPRTGYFFDAMAAPEELKKKNTTNVSFRACVRAPGKPCSAYQSWALTSHVITVANLADSHSLPCGGHMPFGYRLRGQDFLAVVNRSSGEGRADCRLRPQRPLRNPAARPGHHITAHDDISPPAATVAGAQPLLCPP